MHLMLQGRRRGRNSRRRQSRLFLRQPDTNRLHDQRKRGIRRRRRVLPKIVLQANGFNANPSLA
jgi:hypothetical protein